jgi:hypothetical protein
MAPCDPIYSQGKGPGRPASIGGLAKSVFRVIGHCLSDEI